MNVVTKQPGKQQHSPDRIGIYRFADIVSGRMTLHVVLTRNGRTFAKKFFEHRCGGQDQTLLLALAWRDRIIEEHAAISLEQFCAILRRNNTSGVPGVIRTRKRSGSQNGQALFSTYWTARIPRVDGRSKVRNFSVRRFGDEEAKRLAVEARMQGLAELRGVVFRDTVQPQQVSSEADMAALEALLTGPAERKAIKEQQRRERERVNAERAQLTAEARKRALDQHAAALLAPINRSGEPYIGRYLTGEGDRGYWQVSIERNRHKHRKSFSDSQHDGKLTALAAAKAWRDQIFLAHPTAPIATVAARLNGSNTSGMTGVHLIRDVASNAPNSWVARSPKQKGKATMSKRFSIAKYGSEAYAMAVQARVAFLAELGQDPSSGHPAARKLRSTLQPATAICDLTSSS